MCVSTSNEKDVDAQSRSPDRPGITRTHPLHVINFFAMEKIPAVLH